MTTDAPPMHVDDTPSWATLSQAYTLLVAAIFGDHFAHREICGDTLTKLCIERVSRRRQVSSDVREHETDQLTSCCRLSSVSTNSGIRARQKRGWLSQTDEWSRFRGKTPKNKYHTAGIYVRTSEAGGTSERTNLAVNFILALSSAVLAAVAFCVCRQRNTITAKRCVWET